MIRRENELGTLSIGSHVYTQIAGNAATKCFGVKGMAMRSMVDGLIHLLRRASLAKGVFVHFNEDDTLTIDLHIVVDQGVNLVALSNSIISEVRYMVSKQTDTEVKEVNVLVESMMID